MQILQNNTTAQKETPDAWKTDCNIALSHNCYVSD